MPTPAEKRSMLFDPDAPVVNSDEMKAKHPKGYRLFAQNNIGQSQLDAQTIVYCYLGRDIPQDNFEARIAIIFDIWVNVNLETNTRTAHYNRAAAIEQAIKESLNGVNIAGIGTIMYSKYFHGDCGSTAIWDEGTNQGRWLQMAVAWRESGSDERDY